LSPVICRQCTGDKIAGVTDKNRPTVLPSGDWCGLALEDRDHAGGEAEQQPNWRQAQSNHHREFPEFSAGTAYSCPSDT